MLSNADLEKLRAHRPPATSARRPCRSSSQMSQANGEGLREALAALCAAASQAVAEGVTFLVLSDRGVDADTAPIPACWRSRRSTITWCAREPRTQVGLVVETGRGARGEHFALLIGYGASAINPYLAFETLADMKRGRRPAEELEHRKGGEELHQGGREGAAQDVREDGHLDAAELSRRTDLRGDRPLQEARSMQYFTGTPSRLGGVGLGGRCEEEALARHAFAYPPIAYPGEPAISIRAANTSGGASASTTSTIRTRSPGSSMRFGTIELRDVQGVQQGGQRHQRVAGDAARIAALQAGRRRCRSRRSSRQRRS